MKTLQTQYNLIKEGKGSKHIFLKEAKSLYPDMITNFSDFEQTEKILKNRGVINENFVGLRPINDWEPSPKQDYEIAFKNFLSEMEEEKVKADTKKVSKYVEDTDAHNFDNKNRKNIDNLSGQEVLNGFYTELKAPKNVDKTKDELMDIVTKNLSKDPLYYIKNGQFGTEGVGYTEDAPGLGEPKEAKGKYKSSGYGDLDNKQTAPKSNVKDSGKSEYKTGMPKKVKEMDMKAQSFKGVEKMTTPGKPKTVKLNENQESNEDVLKDLISRHDWYFEMSDDNNKYKDGQASEKKVMDLVNRMGIKGKEIYNSMAPKDRQLKESANKDSLKNLLSKHDWYFEMSDDSKKYAPGKRSEKEIMDLVNKMGDEGKKIYNSMAPKDRQLKESVVDKIVESILRRLKKTK
jgi:hypothetical protein